MECQAQSPFGKWDLALTDSEVDRADTHVVVRRHHVAECRGPVHRGVKTKALNNKRLTKP